VIGDGEEAVGEINAVLAAHRDSPREHVLRELAHLPGVYIPSLYDVEYNGAALVSVRPRYADVPERVEKRTVADLAEWPYPSISSSRWWRSSTTGSTSRCSAAAPAGAGSARRG